MAKERLEIARYNRNPSTGGSVDSEPIGEHEFVLAQFGNDERYSTVEIMFRDGRLEVRAKEGVLEIAPGGSNTVFVQVRTPFGDVHGGFRAYTRGR